MKLAIYGYDTMVGRLLLEELEKSEVKVDSLFPLSPIAGEYDAVPFRKKNYVISHVDEFDFAEVNVALFLTTKDESERLIPRAQEAGCVVIDDSHLYAGSASKPMVLKDINPFDVAKILEQKIACVPLSTTTELALSLNPIHNEFGIKQAVVTAMLATSEQGELGVQTLAKETTMLLNGHSIDLTDFPAQTAFNVHHTIGAMSKDNVSVYEQTVKAELFGLLDQFPMALTCMQVPVFYGHTLSVHVDLEEDCSLEEMQQCLKNTKYLAFEHEVLAESLAEALAEAEALAAEEEAERLDHSGPSADVSRGGDNEDFADEERDANEDDEVVEEVVEKREIKVDPALKMVSPVACADLDNQLYVCRLRKSGRAAFDFTVIMDNSRYGEAYAAISVLKLLDGKF